MKNALYQGYSLHFIGIGIMIAGASGLVSHNSDISTLLIELGLLILLWAPFRNLKYSMIVAGVGFFAYQLFADYLYRYDTSIVAKLFCFPNLQYRISLLIMAIGGISLLIKKWKE